MKVYMAGPLFTPYHRAFIARNAERLPDAGFVCLVPHERGIVHEIDRAAGKVLTPAQIFQMDYKMVADANAIVALLDDPDVSSGTAAEIGIFYGLMQHDRTKKGILGLLTDARAWKRAGAGAPPINAFTLGTVEAAGAVYRRLDEIIAHLDLWRRELRSDGLLG